MKTIEERAKEWGEHIVETTPYDVVDGKACVFVEDRNIADVAEESYIAGATEQKAIDEEVRLKKCDDIQKRSITERPLLLIGITRMEKEHQHILMPLSGQGKK